MTLSRSRCVAASLALFGLFVLVRPAAAQEATLSGTITDSTGGVLPGVTVKAQHVESGNTFESVTDARGAFRLQVRVGEYKLTAELQGFTTFSRSGIELLVGQTTDLTVQMADRSVAGRSAAIPFIDPRKRTPAL